MATRISIRLVIWRVKLHILWWWYRLVRRRYQLIELDRQQYDD